MSHHVFNSYIVFSSPATHLLQIFKGFHIQRLFFDHYLPFSLSGTCFHQIPANPNCFQTLTHIFVIHPPFLTSRTNFQLLSHIINQFQVLELVCEHYHIFQPPACISQSNFIQIKIALVGIFIFIF